ncbi:MAG: hypothetical protein ACE5HE_05895 [Phycisphaerae bacterium]
MTSHEDQPRAIERDERWLREVWCDAGGPDIDLVMQRVSIELNERWLEGRVDIEPPADLIHGVERRVRSALAAERRKPALLRRGVTWRSTFVFRAACAAASAAAALVFLLVWLDRRVPALPEFSALTAFEAFEEDDLTLSLADVEDRLTELESAFDTVATSYEEEEAVDELYERIDSMLGNDGLENGWL